MLENVLGLTTSGKRRIYPMPGLVRRRYKKQPLTIIQYEKGKSSPSVNFVYTLQNIGFDIVYLMTAEYFAPN